MHAAETERPSLFSNREGKQCAARLSNRRSIRQTAYALPDDLKPLFVAAYFTGVRLGELLAWQWEQVDWKQGFITLNAEETKSGYSRAVPILKGDMRRWLKWAHDNANGCPWVFNRIGEPIKNFQRAWQTACASVGIPDLKFHDLRRTAVRNMRRAGVPQESVCASPGTERILWSDITTLWMSRT